MNKDNPFYEIRDIIEPSPSRIGVDDTSFEVLSTTLDYVDLVWPTSRERETIIQFYDEITRPLARIPWNSDSNTQLLEETPQ